MPPTGPSRVVLLLTPVPSAPSGRQRNGRRCWLKAGFRVGRGLHRVPDRQNAAPQVLPPAQTNVSYHQGRRPGQQTKIVQSQTESVLTTPTTVPAARRATARRDTSVTFRRSSSMQARIHRPDKRRWIPSCILHVNRRSNMQRKMLANFHRSRAAHYRALFEAETHPALRQRWTRQMRKHIRRAQELEV